MAIIKSSPSELAIHGGGPPAFASKVPVFSANVGDGHRFGELAERMFLASEPPGGLAEEFEVALGKWVDVRNVVGFSSLPAAMRCLQRAAGLSGRILMPALGAESYSEFEQATLIESEPTRYGICAGKLSDHMNDDVAAVLAIHPLGRPCLVQELEDQCDEWGVPLFMYGHQALGATYSGERLGSFGHAEIFELGRDQLIHAMDAAVISTDDDLLAYRLRSLRSQHVDRIDQGVGDAASAMGIANLESAATFIDANRVRFEIYRESLRDVPGVKLMSHERGTTYQSIAIEVDPGLAGLTRDALYNVLAAENVETAKPFEPVSYTIAPTASRLASSLLQLPSGPNATEEAIKAVSKLVELAIVRSLESPDPIHLAA